jgi:hypothetical protein
VLCSMADPQFTRTLLTSVHQIVELSEPSRVMYTLAQLDVNNVVYSRQENLPFASARGAWKIVNPCL